MDLVELNDNTTVNQGLWTRLERCLLVKQGEGLGDILVVGIYLDTFAAEHNRPVTYHLILDGSRTVLSQYRKVYLT